MKKNSIMTTVSGHFLELKPKRRQLSEINNELLNEAYLPSYTPQRNQIREPSRSVNMLE